jgi:uncharacterized RDD family membrane protein YckC
VPELAGASARCYVGEGKVTTEQPFPPPAASSYDPRSSAVAGVELASFWRRFGAYIIDGAIVFAVGVFAGAIVGAMARTSGGIGVGGGLVGLILGVAYFGYFWSHSGQSLGYMAFGLKLVRADGAPVSFGFAALRYLVIYLSLLVCGIPALISAFMVGMGKQKQALHDLIVGTLVVRT